MTFKSIIRVICRVAIFLVLSFFLVFGLVKTCNPDMGPSIITDKILKVIPIQSTDIKSEVKDNAKIEIDEFSKIKKELGIKKGEDPWDFKGLKKKERLKRLWKLRKFKHLKNEVLDSPEKKSDKKIKTLQEQLEKTFDTTSSEEWKQKYYKDGQWSQPIPEEYKDYFKSIEEKKKKEFSNIKRYWYYDGKFQNKPREMSRITIFDDDIIIDIYDEETSTKGDWIEYRPEILENLNGKPYMLHFTAKWCALCQLQHKYVINKKVSKLARDNNIALIKVDLSRDNPEGIELLSKYSRSGIPVYVFVDSSGKEIVIDQIWSKDTTLEHLNKISDETMYSKISLRNIDKFLSNKTILHVTPKLCLSCNPMYKEYYKSGLLRLSKKYGVKLGVFEYSKNPKSLVYLKKMYNLSETPDFILSDGKGNIEHFGFIDPEDFKKKIREL